VPHKHLLVQSAAREKILRGAAQLADAVGVTLGPRSKCVLIEKPDRGGARRQARQRDARFLKRALETPARQIAANSGADGGVVVDRMCSRRRGEQP